MCLLSFRPLGCDSVQVNYPSFAYAPNGELWWKLTRTPGKDSAYGDERKIAAYLASTKKVGDLVTTRELREQLAPNPETPNTNEHLQRRLRSLRGERDGWVIASKKDDRSLPPEHYRIDKIGWHPGLGDRPPNRQVVSAKTRALVLTRDGSRCQVCGVGDGEPYPENPDRKAVMTVGHIVSQHFGGGNDRGNLRTECALCNEQMRSEGTQPESFEEVWSAVRSLSTPSLRRLNEWLAQGKRTRDALDETYDRIRKLRPDDTARVKQDLANLLGLGPNH